MEKENTLSILASSAWINPANNSKLDVEVTLSDDEFKGLLECYSIKDLISYHGAYGILEEIDTDVIMDYLNGIGVKTEWED